MSFSPLSLVLSLAITGPAFLSFVMASDRHYPVFSDSRGSFFWIEDGDSLTAFSEFQTSDICLRSRPYEIDIREQQSFPTQVSKQPQSDIDNGSDVHYQLARTIILPMKPEPLKYDRVWIGSCEIPGGYGMIKVIPLDARMPFDAIPVSYNSDQQVSACLKIDREGDVIDFKLARPGGEASSTVAERIQEVAKTCWKFENQSDRTGWIQVGLDRREKAISL